MVFSLVKENHLNTFYVEKTIILETTRLFLSKNNDFTKLQFKDEKLYFDNNLLLEHISKFVISEINNIKNINICIENDEICQVWKLRL
jgi:hypothetical protein